MTLSLFDVRPDDSIGAWFLDTPHYENGEEILGLEFRRGQRWDREKRLRTSVYSEGVRVSFCRGGRGTFYIASHLMRVLRSVISDDRLEGIPVEISGCSEEYEILNVLDIVDCVDEDRSEFGKWTESGGRPEMIGRYRGIPKMVLDGGAVARA